MSARASIESLARIAQPHRVPARHVLRTADLSGPQLLFLLHLAAEMRSMPGRWRHLQGHTVACLFEKPSTRTRVSLEVAVTRLGAHPLMLRPGELQLGRGEPIEDTGRVLGAMCDLIVARVVSHETLERLTAVAGVPVVNGLSDMHHPCQALADLLTLRDLFGSLEGLKLAYVGDGNNVAHSLLEAAGPAGMHVAVATPPGYEPDPEVMARASRSAEEGGGRVSLVTDPAEAVEGADAVYTDVWVSMGDESEREARLRDLARYHVDAAFMGRASKSAVFMHCLPAHRGEEVDAEVIDGPNSVVWVQAANRTPTEQALLWALMTDQLPGPVGDSGRGL